MEPGALDGVDHIEMIDPLHVREGAPGWDNEPAPEGFLLAWYERNKLVEPMPERTALEPWLTFGPP
jgi:hypothetical protein